MDLQLKRFLAVGHGRDATLASARYALLSANDLRTLQTAVATCLVAGYYVPGEKRPRRRKTTTPRKHQPWNWHKTLSLAVGELQIDEPSFWRLSFAAWRSILAGYEQRLRRGRHDRAWMVSHQLVATGCAANKVTPAKLLGEKEPRPKRRRSASSSDSGEQQPLAADERTVDYDVFFAATKSHRKGRVNLFVQSAFVRDAARLPAGKPIRFEIILYNVLNRKAIKA